MNSLKHYEVLTVSDITASDWLRQRIEFTWVLEIMGVAGKPPVKWKNGRFGILIGGA